MVGPEGTVKVILHRRRQSQAKAKFLKLLNDCETEAIFKRELDTPELKLTLHVLQSHLTMKHPQFTSGKATQGPEEFHNRKFQD